MIGFSKAQCPGKADIVFAVPGSDMVPGQEFFPFERFLISLVSYFQLDPDNVNIGLIVYGKEPVAIGWPQPFKTQTQVNTRITLMSQRPLYYNQLNGGNDVSAAIMLMRNMFKNPTGYPLQMPRPGAKKIGVVFTYNSAPEAERQQVIEAAEGAQKDGITMYAVGKGQAGPEFSSIGSDYCKSFSMGRFIDGLPNVLAYLGSSICTELDPRVNASVGNCFPHDTPLAFSARNIQDIEELFQRKKPEAVSCYKSALIFQDPANCAYFYHCLFRRPVQERCPLNMLFDPIAQSCNYKDFVSCYTDITCPVRTGLFPHPSACDKYVNCFDFRPYIQSCPEGLWFDAATGGCENRDTVACPMN